MLSPWIEAWHLRELVLKEEIRPREVAEFFLARVERLNPACGAFMTITAERALEDADRLESLDGDARAVLQLLGVAYSLKDLTWTKGIRTTFGSRNYADFIPPADQDYAARIAAAGGILLGKTTTPEFGGKPTTEGGLCPPARNPWKLTHTAGGSSGGAAAAVGMGLGPIAEGSDGGGSIRIPAACCGLVGLKPSRGRVSFAPVMGEAWAGFATNGPLARSVRDAALLLDAMAGPADGDPYWAAPSRHRFVDAVNLRPRQLQLAAIAESALGTVDSEVRAALDSACEVFRAMGHTIAPLRLDPASQLKAVTEKIVYAGIGSIPISDLDAMDPTVRSSWEKGQAITAAEYLTNVTVMHNVSREIVRELSRYDALLTPTLSRPPMELGTLYPNPERALEECLSWLPFTFPFNATGQPAISIPNGFTRSGLPIGLQIVGRPADEIGIIALAAAFEEARPWPEHPPSAE